MPITHINLSKSPVLTQNRVITIGAFDGFHIGHQKLLNEFNHYAKEHGLKRTLVTFSPLPSEYFNRNNFVRLMSLRDKVEYLVSHDLIDELILIPFSKKFSLMSAQDFLENKLIKDFSMKALFVGNDFRFGHKAQGDIEYLTETLDGKYRLYVMDDLIRKGHRVSSTKIREFLSNNDLQSAREFLGRRYSLTGRVIHGNKLARQWGMPTINIAIKHNFPTHGIFNVVAESLTTGKVYTGAASMGTRPTIRDSKLSLEVHLHDTDEDLYGQIFKIIFINRTRDEVKFETIEELRKEIERDITNSYSFFKDFSEQV